MDAFEILALIFAILVCLATIPNILVIIGFYGWVIYLAWIATIEDIISSIIIMVGACTTLSAGSYKVCMSLLIFGDVVALINIIAFELYLRIFNWPQLLDILFITPLIIFADNIRKKRMNMPMIAPVVGYGTPMVVQNAPYQPGYVQTSNVPNAYQPPS